MPSTKSKIHRIAIMQQENGELAEDVVEMIADAEDTEVTVNPRTAERLLDSGPIADSPEQLLPLQRGPSPESPRPSDSSR